MDTNNVMRGLEIMLRDGNLLEHQTMNSDEPVQEALRRIVSFHGYRFPKDLVGYEVIEIDKAHIPCIHIPEKSVIGGELSTLTKTVTFVQENSQPEKPVKKAKKKAVTKFVKTVTK